MENSKDKPWLECMGRSQALRTEAFLVGIQINEETIDQLKVFLPKGLEMRSINSDKKAKKIPKENSFLISRKDLWNPNLLSMRMNYVDELNKSKDVSIGYYGLIEDKIVFEAEFKINILIPELSVEITKTDSNNAENGFIDMKITQHNDAIFSIRDIDIEAYCRGTQNLLPMKKKRMGFEQYLKYIEKLPDHVYPENYIGKISFPENVEVDIRIKITIVDILSNNYFQESNLLEINQRELPQFLSNPIGIPKLAMAARC